MLSAISGLVKWLMAKRRTVKSRTKTDEPDQTEKKFSPIMESLGNHVYKMFNCGSAYEKHQAGEATDFDVMLFLNVRKWQWKVHVGFISLIL